MSVSREDATRRVGVHAIERSRAGGALGKRESGHSVAAHFALGAVEMGANPRLLRHCERIKETNRTHHENSEEDDSGSEPETRHEHLREKELPRRACRGSSSFTHFMITIFFVKRAASTVNW
jgi:hypothetical protein